MYPVLMQLYTTCTKVDSAIQLSYKGLGRGENMAEFSDEMSLYEMCLSVISCEFDLINNIFIKGA